MVLVWFSFLQQIDNASYGEALRSTIDLEQTRACDGQFKEEYQLVSAVGKGAFGFVWKAIRRSDGQEVRKLPCEYISTAVSTERIMIVLYCGNYR